MLISKLNGPSLFPYQLDPNSGHVLKCTPYICIRRLSLKTKVNLNKIRDRPYLDKYSLRPAGRIFIRKKNENGDKISPISVGALSLHACSFKKNLEKEKSGIAYSNKALDITKLKMQIGTRNREVWGRGSCKRIWSFVEAELVFNIELLTNVWFRVVWFWWPRGRCGVCDFN